MSGIFVTKGSTLRVSELSISFSDDIPSTLTLEVGLDVYPLWLRSAIAQARQAESAARELDKIWDGSGSGPQTELSELEMSASMSSLVSSAAAIDSFYGSVIDRCPSVKPPAKSKTGRSRARERVILSTFQQRFSLGNKTLSQMRQPLADIFRFRHLALHARGRPEPPVEHPRLKVGMSQKQVIFRAENAINATSFALVVVSHLITRPHARYPDLRKHCEAARDWLTPLLIDWETDHASLGLSLPLIERSTAKKNS